MKKCKTCGEEIFHKCKCPIKNIGNKSASVMGYKAMSLDRAITLLKDRAEKGECDGDCDDKKPFIKCKECEAARVLNEVNDIVRMAL